MFAAKLRQFLVGVIDNFLALRVGLPHDQFGFFLGLSFHLPLGEILLGHIYSRRLFSLLVSCRKLL